MVRALAIGRDGMGTEKTEASGVSWVSHVPNANQQKRLRSFEIQRIFFQDQQ
jgi:hypothetical protein